MDAVTSNTKTTLLLNNAWQPITTVTARSAFTHLLKGNICALDKDGNVFSSLDNWNTYASFHDDQPMLRSQNGCWPIPTIIVVTSKFFKRPKKKRLSLYETAKVYDNTCQYCLEKFSLGDLSIDHIMPRSNNGSDEHFNRILACRKCNTKKSNHLNWKNIEGEIPKPLPIPETILHCPHIRDEWKDFLGRLA